MKSARITACTFKKSFSSQHGTFYSHAITLDNGDTGEINAKEEMPAFLAQGQMLWYEVTPNGKYAAKIKRMKAPDGAQENGQQNSNELIGVIGRIGVLEEVVRQLVKHTKMAYVAPKPKPEPVKHREISPAQVTTMENDYSSNDEGLPF